MITVHAKRVREDVSARRWAGQTCGEAGRRVLGSAGGQASRNTASTADRSNPTAR